MKRKQRPSDPRKRFNILDKFKGLNRLRLTGENTGDIFAVGPEGDGTIGVNNCSTLVLQAMPRRKKGKRQQPVTVFWHMPTVNFDEGRRLEAMADMGGRQIIPWQRTLSESGALSHIQSNAIAPKKLIKGMLRYLEENKPSDSKIEATILPGINTQLPKHKEHNESMAAVDGAKAILTELKKAGRIRNVRTRGFSPHADNIGSQVVWIDEKGTIHRQLNRKRSSAEDVLQ